jgi:NADPH:quinone reductase-like Zn-dependent oxidoreductase
MVGGNHEKDWDDKITGWLGPKRAKFAGTLRRDLRCLYWNEYS